MLRRAPTPTAASQDAALFEVGQIFAGEKPEDQSNAASGARTGAARLTGGGRRWDGAAKAVDVFDAKADALSVLEALGLAADTVQITRNTPDWYHPGRSGALQLGPKIVLQSPDRPGLTVRRIARDLHRVCSKTEGFEHA